MKDLAICIPTYKSALIINEYLDNSISVLSELEIDLYIYDSSPDDETFKVIKQYNSFSNLYYIRLPESIHSNMKVYQIFQKKNFEYEYKYVWLNLDYVKWTKEVFLRVLNYVKLDYDMIVVDNNDMYNLREKEYTDKKLFFKECCWRLVTYLGAILKSSTMLEGTNWFYLVDKYGVKDKINFSHIGFYFEKIAELENFKAFHFSVYYGDFISSSLKKGSMWIKDAIELWGEYYPSAIFALPNLYDEYKTYVVKIHNLSMNIINIDNLLAMRYLKLYDESVYKRFEGRWNMISILPENVLQELSKAECGCMTCDGEKYLYFNEKTILSFANSAKRLYIYGGGKFAKKCQILMNMFNYPVECNIVTNKNANDSNNDISIIDLDEFIKIRQPSDKVIIALGERNKQEVCADLFKRKESPDIYFTGCLPICKLPAWAEQYV